MVTFEVEADSVAVSSFRSERLLGERMRRTHRADLERMHQVPAVMANVGGVRTPEESTAWLNTQLSGWAEFGFGQWIMRTHDGAFVGRGGLRQIDPSVGEDLVEVGYVLDQPAWGQGFATEAAAAFIQIARAHYGLFELGAITLEGNDASTRVLEKNGFVFERWIEHRLGPHKFLRRVAVPLGG